MENYYSSHEEGFEGLDARHEAQRFEEKLSGQGNFYMDVVTIEEVYEYYRVMDQPDKANNLLDFAINQYPHNADFYFKKSCLASDQENYADAYVLIQKALDLNPTELPFVVQKARVLHELDHFDQALRTLLQALDETEDATERAEVFFQLGQLCQEDERYSQAIHYYTQALAGNNEYEDALFEVCYCYEMLGQNLEGIAYLEDFLNNVPYSSCGWYNLGTLLHKTGLFEKASSAFDYAIVIQEDFISAYYGKANALMELERYEEAIRVCLQSLQYDKNDIATLLCLGECYENVNEFTRARYYYAKCTDLYNQLPDAWYGIGSTFEAEKRYLEAIHYYKRTLDINKDFIDAWLGLADCEYLLGNEVAAQEALRSAIALFPQDLEMWTTWAERLQQDKGADAALAFLDEALTHNPGMPELFYQYAAFSFMAGKHRQALQYLENALMVDYPAHAAFLQYMPTALEHAPIRALLEQYKPAV